MLFNTGVLKTGLMVNPSKTKAMVMGNSTKLLKLKLDRLFNINGKDIQFVKKFTYLGIIIDNTMSLRPFLCDTKKKINNKIFLLRKIRRYITDESALLIYNQTILPFFDYSRFMCICLNIGDKRDLQIMQNDALRYCYNVRLADRVTIDDLHARAKLSSLEQRRIRQLLGLQYLLYKKDTDRHVIRANIRSQQKYVFKVDTKIGKNMKDHRIILEPYYGINYHEKYKLLIIFSFLNKKWHDCTNVLMKSM